MVTGKNKEHFEKWYFEHFKCMNPLVQSVNQFYQLERFEMQLGVYLAYYDSLSIFIDSDLSYDLVDEELSDEWESGFWHKKDYRSTKGYFNSRNEAYKEAFKQVDKLKNGKI